jgi:hypothetical protein
MGHHPLKQSQVVFGIVTATMAANNQPLQFWQMTDDAPRVDLVFVSHVPLPLTGIKVKRSTALESGCGLDIM